ncbi:MAG: protein phosphatase 2C domain-containing protein [Synergistaceae bacterium]|jgi:serine/threonine protein phosphatase PrpC|nr:protein phosphatase 2C domain-containing protein [Synergistaceae bacterium]
MKRRCFNVTCPGASHVREGKVCQDASGRVESGGFLAVIVADGHGADDYMRSDLGSKFAVEACGECIGEFMGQANFDCLDGGDSKGLLAQLKKSVIARWHEKVRGHFRENPFTDEETDKLSVMTRRRYLERNMIEPAYGTTLIAAVAADDFWFGLHIGDGRCVTKGYDLVFSQPIPWDEKCFLNVTTSLCDEDAFERSRHCFSRDVPAAIFIGSDGIDDCFANDGQIYALYDNVICNFGLNGFDEAHEMLAEYLPKLSAKGSRDDMSMAGIFDAENIQFYMRVTEQEERAPPERERTHDAGTEETVETASEPDGRTVLELGRETCVEFGGC